MFRIIVTQTDQHLIRGAVLGSEEALTAVLAKYDPLFVRAVRSILGRDQDVEDVLQEVRMHVSNGIANFDDSRPFAPWARAIARNAAIQAARRSVRGPVSSNEVPEPATDIDPSQHLILKGESERIRHALKSLPEKYARVLDLRIARGLSHRDIGELLGLSAAATRVRFTRALSALRARVRRES